MSIALADNDVSSALVGADLAIPAALMAPAATKPARQGPGRVRLPDKTIYSLRDLLALSIEGRADMQEILYWIDRERIDAKGRYDAARLSRLGELSHIVAHLALVVGDIERMTGDARLGLYEPSVVLQAQKESKGNGQ